MRISKSNIFSNNNEYNTLDVSTVLNSMLQSLSNSKFKNYFIIKGGSALMIMFKEMNETEYIRETTDIDIHCSDREVWNEFIYNCESILNNNNNGFKFTLIKERKLTAETSSSSLKFNVFDYINNKECTVKIDMNIKSNNIIGYKKFKSIDLNHFDFYTMLSDKIVVCCSKKIFRRIKDLYDLYTITRVSEIELIKLINRLELKHGIDKLEMFINEENYNDLEHAYSKYKGLPIDIDFNELYIYAINFLCPFIRYYNKEINLNDYFWYPEKHCWGRLI